MENGNTWVILDIFQHHPAAYFNPRAHIDTVMFYIVSPLLNRFFKGETSRSAIKPWVSCRFQSVTGLSVRRFAITSLSCLINTKLWERLSRDNNPPVDFSTPLTVAASGACVWTIQPSTLAPMPAASQGFLSLVFLLSSRWQQTWANETHPRRSRAFDLWGLTDPVMCWIKVNAENFHAPLWVRDE